MNTKYIEFKKKRELGDIISNTFAFLRQNGKSLFYILIQTAGVPFLLLLLTSAYNVHLFNGIIDIFKLKNGEILESGNFIFSFLLRGITLMVFYGVLFGTTLHYIKSYIDNKGVINKIDVIVFVKKDLMNIIGLAIISGLITFIGFLFCVLPGVYLYIPMSLVFPIFIFQNTSVGNAIEESFRLIKNEWWITFASFFIIGILTAIISSIFTIPTLVYSFISALTIASETSVSTSSESIDWFLISLNTISTAGQYMLHIIIVIASAFIYFNLNERKNFTGTFEQIDSLGENK